METKKSKSTQIGAAWLRKTKAGDDYLSIAFDIKEVLPDIPRKGIFGFKTKNKQNENTPDYQLVLFGDEK